MREILAALDAFSEQREAVAIGTLVRVRGSAPRRPGARVLCAASGRIAGSVSGGCVENDVLERARAVLAAGAPVLASYGIDDETGFAVGLACGGSIDVLIEPFVATEAWAAVRRSVEGERPAALAIGLAPAALLGRKLAVLGPGETVGSIAADVDARVRAAAAGLLLRGGARVLNVPRADGEASVFVETFRPPERLFIVGATHTAMPLCRMAKGLGFRVAIVDARGTFATRERFAEADDLVLDWPDRVLGDARLDSDSYVAVLTHDPKFDLPALAVALRSSARYVGVIGSRATHAQRVVRLREEHGVGEPDLARLRAPIGLDIGAGTPEEVALAILAEMVAVREQRDGRPLRDRDGLIHGDG
jgi:xanthine dehydrogenase accessory factor